MSTTNISIRDLAIAQANSIISMVAALEVDYDRLEELRHMSGLSHDDVALEELDELREATNGCADLEDAIRQIQEDPLSVEVRSGWVAAYGPDGMNPEEFRIVLCTGGPHVEIRGELCDGEPYRAWIAYRGWGESGELHGHIEQDTLLAYCAQFFAG